MSRFPRPQRGAATLIVVMVLFFLVSMVAAYTSRNLVFEQRTSVNQYRATQAMEAAQAGVEWAVAMLNSGKLNDACETDSGGSSLRMNAIENLLGGNYAPMPNFPSPICVWSGSRDPDTLALTGKWVCNCSKTAGGLPVVGAPADGSVQPAFRVIFKEPDTVFPENNISLSAAAAAGVVLRPVDPLKAPGQIQLRVIGCTRPDGDLGAGCLAPQGIGVSNEAVVKLSTILSPVGTVTGAPNATVLGLDKLDFSDLSTDSFLANPANAGVVVQGGQSVKLTSTKLYGAAGGVGQWSENDLALDPSAPSTGPLRGLPEVDIKPTGKAKVTKSPADRLFASIFGLWAETFVDQPALVKMDCAGGCSFDEVATKVNDNPGRPVWAKGTVNWAPNATLPADSQAPPMLLIVEGQLNLSGGSLATEATRGFIYIRGKNTGLTGGGHLYLRGALVMENEAKNLTGATVRIIRDADVLRSLRYGAGTLRPVGGSWRDF